MSNTWEWDRIYPVRCQIVNPEGQTIAPGVVAKQPDRAVPHEGEFGVAERSGFTVKITLESGEIIYGNECWWIPLPPLDHKERERPVVSIDQQFKR